jgi:hypothetical protein
VAIRVGRGRSAVTITGPLADGIERDLRQILGPVTDVMERAAEEVLNDSIRPNWPVKSGDSLKAWDTRLQVEPGQWKVAVELYNPLKYTRYIKSTKRGRRRDAVRVRSPLQKDALRPARAKLKEIKPQLIDALAKGLTEALNG